MRDSDVNDFPKGSPEMFFDPTSPSEPVDFPAVLETNPPVAVRTWRPSLGRNEDEELQVGDTVEIFGLQGTDRV